MSPDPSIYSSVDFPPLGHSDHVVSVSIDFPLNLKENALFIKQL